MKVLVADTDWRFAAQVTEHLESHAHLVAQTTHKNEIAERAQHWQCDLVVLSADLASRGVLEELQAIPNRPAILLTGWMHRYDLAWRAWQIGGDELLMKPVFHSQEVHQAVVTALENRTACRRERAVAATA